MVLDLAQLLISYKNKPDIKTRNLIVQRSFSKIQGIAKKWSNKMRFKIPEEDLFQQGVIGAIKAINNYVIKTSTELNQFQFLSYLDKYIEGEIINYIKDKEDNIQLPRNYRCLYRKGEEFKQNFYRQTQKYPESPEIASHLNITLKTWQIIEFACTRRFFSLDQPIEVNDKQGSLMGEYIITPKDSQDDDKDDNSLLKQLLSVVDSYLNKLSLRQQEIIKLRIYEQLSWPLITEKMQYKNTHDVRKLFYQAQNKLIALINKDQKIAEKKARISKEQKQSHVAENRVRNSLGEFSQKSQEYHHVRSIRLSDSTWDKLERISKRNHITKADLLEKWFSDPTVYEWLSNQ